MRALMTREAKSGWVRRSPAAHSGVLRQPLRPKEISIDDEGIDDEGQAVELVRAARRVCPYSNATRNNIEVKLTANQAPVDEA